MQTNIVDPLSDPRWDVWIRSHRDCSIFHSAAWARVLSKTYSHKPMSLRLCREGETTALVPLMEVESALTSRRGVSVPFADSCPPLLFDQSSPGPVFDALAALGQTRKWKYFELRGSAGLQGEKKTSVEFLGHKLNLSGETETLFGSFASSVRRAVRKAERSGLQVFVARTREAVIDYYGIHCRTRKRHGAPPQPLSFFLSIYDEIIKSGAGFIVLARDGSQSVAGAVFFHFGKNAIYKFGASIKDGREVRANNLVMWEGIKALKQAGCDVLDFGRTSFANEGLRRFKLGWGTQEETIGYFKFDCSTANWVAGRDRASGFCNSIFSCLPLSVNRVAGAILYPHLD